MVLLFAAKCRFVNDVLHIREREKDLFRREPIERTHGKIVVFSAVNSKLLFKVIKRVECVGSIEVFVIFAVRALNLAVVPRRVWLDELVPYPTLFEARLKQCGRGACGMS